jgi:segregation and condensation protein B
VPEPTDVAALMPDEVPLDEFEEDEEEDEEPEEDEAMETLPDGEEPDKS